MRLTWRDAMATIFVAAAALVYGLWHAGTAMTGTSTRAIAVVVFALGWLACTSDASRMTSVYLRDAEDRPSMAYTVVASALGFVALLAGIWAVVAASETMLAILVAAMIALWLMTTIRHALSVTARHVAAPTAHAA